MTNLALAFAQVVFWLLAYTSVDRWIVNLVGYELRNFAAIGVIFLLWFALLVPLKRMRIPVPVSPMYLLLALSNAILLLTLIVHAYNDYHPHESTTATMSIEDIMTPRFSMSVELYLRAAYPLAGVILMVSAAVLAVHLIKSFREKHE